MKNSIMMPLRCLHRQHAATYKLTPDDIYACMSLQKQLKPATSFYIVPRWVQNGTAMTISAMTANLLDRVLFPDGLISLTIWKPSNKPT